MVNVGIVAFLEAKPDKEEEVASLLKSAQALAQQEAGTVTWYAFRAGPASLPVGWYAASSWTSAARSCLALADATGSAASEQARARSKRMGGSYFSLALPWNSGEARNAASTDGEISGAST